VKGKAPAKQSSKAKKVHAKKAAPKATAQPAKKVQPKA
jgi:hypothetical protein